MVKFDYLRAEMKWCDYWLTPKKENIYYGILSIKVKFEWFHWDLKLTLDHQVQ